MSGSPRFTPEDYDRIARSDCFVCRIVAGNPLVANPRIIYEDEQVIAFLNQFPTQVGYTLVCPKRHVERWESELDDLEWMHVQSVVRAVARAVAEVTGAMRVYVASLGSPERNAHVHFHVCPCPPGTPFDQQQFAAMDFQDGQYLQLDNAQLDELAEELRTRLST